MFVETTFFTFQPLKIKGDKTRTKQTGGWSFGLGSDKQTMGFGPGSAATLREADLHPTA